MRAESHLKSLRTEAAAMLLAVASCATALFIAPQVSGAANHAASTGGQCPWIAQSLRHSATPIVLANEVLAKMTLKQKAGFAVLSTRGALENSNNAIPSLCIPALTLTDGPDGVANGLTGVTQLPAAIAIAASFDPAVARESGQVMASEARTKGISAVQGPELNLARIAQGGRVFETFGEDPWLTSEMGVAAIKGIQSTGELANAKHFTAYTQETARDRLNQAVTARALAELYNAPFKAAVQQGHVASLMCSYGSLNGINTCSDPSIYATLKSWGFKGFVRSDLGAIKKMAPAYRAGLALMKPASPTNLANLVSRGIVPMSDLDNAVRSILFEMFLHGLITHPLHVNVLQPATTPTHSAVALRAAESGVVLLKNAGSTLPLTKNVKSVAVIGVGGALSPSTTGGGSSKVRATYVITPLSALRSALGRTVGVSYKPGGPATMEIDKLSDVDITKGLPLKVEKPLKPKGEPGKADLAIETAPGVTPAIATAAKPGTGEGWTNWSMKMRAKRTGTYAISFQQFGDTWVYLNGQPILESPGLHAPADMATSVNLTAGRQYTLSARWFSIPNHPAPKLGLMDVTPQINAAVAAAKKAQVAIVVVGNYSTEGADRASLNLPGDQNQLIAAVAAANPRTIVILQTGGAAFMPWLSKVAGVLEAWYPGQEDGAALASILTGAVDPSGRLPITFPASDAALAAATTHQFPGVNGTVDFGTGLNIGYRWYQANNVQPLFAFGYGLDYTTFRLTNPSVRKSSSAFDVSVTVTNTGSRPGADVVQAYVHYPSSTGEPPEQLRNFARVLLAPSANKRVTMVLPFSDFQVYLHNSFSTVKGNYRIDLGQSSANLPLHVNVSLP